MIAFRPHIDDPDTTPPDEAGLTWRYTDAWGQRVATVYASGVEDGFGADFAARSDLDATCLIVGGGLPRLPLTDPEHPHDVPLAWHQVCAEVEAHLAAENWSVRPRPEAP